MFMICEIPVGRLLEEISLNSGFVLCVSCSVDAVCDLAENYI